jgi:hypothetical protein
MRIPFSTPEEKRQIIIDQLANGYVLRAVQHHFDGKWLVFKLPEISPRSLKDIIDNHTERLNRLKDRVEQLENP